MEGTKKIRWPTKYKVKPKGGQTDLRLTHNKKCQNKSLNVALTKQTSVMDEMHGRKGKGLQGLAAFVFFEIWCSGFFFLLSLSKCHLPFFINSLSAVTWVWWRKTFRWRTEVESSEGRDDSETDEPESGYAVTVATERENLSLSNTEATCSN